MLIANTPVKTISFSSQLHLFLEVTIISFLAWTAHLF